MWSATAADPGLQSDPTPACGTATHAENTSCETGTCFVVMVEQRRLVFDDNLGIIEHVCTNNMF